MSPIGGVGVNIAIQDAVAASNILAAPAAGKATEGSDSPPCRSAFLSGRSRRRSRSRSKQHHRADALRQREVKVPFGVKRCSGFPILPPHSRATSRHRRAPSNVRTKPA